MNAARLSAAFLSALFAQGCAESPPALVYTEERAACADRDPLRRVFFGDLHAHGRWSFDAYAYGTRATPAEVFAFARGAPVRLAPLGPDGQGKREVRLARPLDFAALTEHHEYLGELRLCLDPASAAYDTGICSDYRLGGMDNVVAFGTRLTSDAPTRIDEICGADGAACRAAAEEVWREIQAAAEAAYDRSARCAFTSFVGYEYTDSWRVTNLHRYVIFRNAIVPLLPPSYFEAPDPAALWAALRAACALAGPACEVITVPHNSNWSNGQLFQPPADLTFEEARALAETRAAFEPLVEIAQHKGAQECDAHFGSESLCDFEKERGPLFEDCGEEPGSGGMSLMGCVSRYDFVRYVLQAGLRQEAWLGVNPYRLGFIGATDTHNGTPGLVDEDSFPGHVGTTDDTPEKRLSRGNMTHHGVLQSPGALMAVWAVENSRDALWEAFRKREVYATSGPRTELRLFGGFGLPADLCGTKDGIARADRAGVPMGGVLGPATAAQPSFFVLARADREVEPGLLQRLQIVKGWIDADGEPAEAVVDVAGDEKAGEPFDLTTCTPAPGGAEELCAVWTDPNFDPSRPAFYYARVLEVPRCRWSARQCAAVAQPIESCSDPRFNRAIQERAWSSPIFWVGGRAAGGRAPGGRAPG